MTQITLDISTSLDGFVAGPSPTLEDPLGQNGMQLHEWVFGLATWRSEHGQEGGVHDEDDALVARSLATLGAVVMGRKMFSGGSGPWEDDPNAAGWWGDEPPFRLPSSSSRTMSASRSSIRTARRSRSSPTEPNLQSSRRAPPPPARTCA